MKLTIKTIKAFKYEGGWDVRWDDDVPGFGVRIYPSGKKAFVLSYRQKGKKRLMVLGRFGADFTLDEAKALARRARVGVKEGDDPLDVRKKAAQGKRLRDLVDAYIERHAKVHKRTWPADNRRLNRLVPKSLMTRRADSITRQDVAELHHGIGLKTPYEANRLMENLRKMYNLAVIWAFVPEGYPNPAQGIPRFKEKKRKRFLQPDELPALVAAIDAESEIYVRAAIWLYLLTGLRKSELLNARWDHLARNQGILRLPETKSGDEQFATVNRVAMAILDSVPKQEKNPFIICGAKPGMARVNIDKPWRRVRELATVRNWAGHEELRVRELVESLQQELERSPSYTECLSKAKEAGVELPNGLMDLRIHDLRRTVGSWMSQSDVDLNKIKSALRHSNISTTLTYARLGADPAREAFEDHGKRVMEIAGRVRAVESGGE
jgi:integrase